MSVVVAIPKETRSGEKRVALVPDVAKRLKSLNLDIQLESGAAKSAHLDDGAFDDVTIVKGTENLYQNADIILKVTPPTPEEITQFKAGAIVLSYMEPFGDTEAFALLRDGKVTAFSMELVPRISRAQSIDALSSQAATAGYRAALIAAEKAPVFFPMLTTAAGTIRPAKVLVVGAGVAGLQAIATARRLGAIVEAYDVRAAVKEQIQSLGAKFVDIPVAAEGEGGYARELTEEEKQTQQDILAKHVAAADAVITTAAIPGRPSPRIISKEMVAGMKAGAVIVDIAAEGGGNCELTKPGKTTHHKGVTICAPLNIPSDLAVHASEMYSKNLLNFINLIIKDGDISLDWEDQVLVDSLITHDGEIKNEQIKERIEGGAS